MATLPLHGMNMTFRYTASRAAASPDKALFGWVDAAREAALGRPGPPP